MSNLYRIYAGCSVCTSGARGDNTLTPTQSHVPFKFNTGSASYTTRIALLWGLVNAIQHVSNSITPTITPATGTCVEDYPLCVGGIQCINTFCKTYSTVSNIHNTSNIDTNIHNIDSNTNPPSPLPVTLPVHDWSKNPHEASGDRIEACRCIFQSPITQLKLLLTSLNISTNSSSSSSSNIQTNTNEITNITSVTNITSIVRQCFNLIETSLTFILRPFSLVRTVVLLLLLL